MERGPARRVDKQSICIHRMWTWSFYEPREGVVVVTYSTSSFSLDCHTSYRLAGTYQRLVKYCTIFGQYVGTRVRISFAGEGRNCTLGHSGESNRRSRRYRDRLTAKLGPLHVLKSPPCDTFAIRAPCPRARRVEAGGRNLVRVAPQRRRAEVPACASGWSPPCPCARAGLCAPRGVRSSRCLMAVTTGRRT